MTDHLSRPCTAFDGTHLLLSGPLVEVALAVKNTSEESDTSGPLLVFDDMTGRVVDLDLRGTKTDIIARLLQSSKDDDGWQNASQASREPEDGLPAPAPRGRGRPKLGVIAREVTLLPRHWEWLAEQSGGASVARAAVKPKPVPPRKRPTTSHWRWRAICPVLKTQSGLCLPAIRPLLSNGSANGQPTCASTR
jgi:hypothetical protein